MKKILALVMALAMMLMLVACGPAGNQESQPPQGGGEQTNAPQGGGEETQPPQGGADLSGTYDVTIWCPEAAVELTKTQVANFNSSNTMGITINATVEPVS